MKQFLPSTKNRTSFLSFCFQIFQEVHNVVQIRKFSLVQKLVNISVNIAVHFTKLDGDVIILSSSRMSGRFILLYSSIHTNLYIIAWCTEKINKMYVLFFFISCNTYKKLLHKTDLIKTEIDLLTLNWWLLLRHHPHHNSTQTSLYYGTDVVALASNWSLLSGRAFSATQFKI